MRLLLVLLLVSTAALAAPKKKGKKPAPPPANVAAEREIKKTLDAAEEKVGGCVLSNAAPGPISLKVKAKLELNSQGQLFGTTVTLAPAEGAGAEPTRKCIEGVLQAMTWPKVPGPMVNAEREWSFEAK